MPYGFQCFDEVTGQLTYQVTDRLTRILGQINPNSTPNLSGSLIVPSADMAGGTLFVFAFNGTAVSNQALANRVESVSISGNTINYTDISYPIMYGVY